MLNDRKLFKHLQPVGEIKYNSFRFSGETCSPRSGIEPSNVCACVCFRVSTDCAVNSERYRDKTVLAAAADQSRGSTIKVSVAGSGKQSSPGVEGTFPVARATTTWLLASRTCQRVRRWLARNDRIFQIFWHECPSSIEIVSSVRSRGSVRLMAN